MTYRIGIIAALFGELKPLVNDWSQQADGAFLTQRGNVAAIAVRRDDAESAFPRHQLRESELASAEAS